MRDERPPLTSDPLGPLLAAAQDDRLPASLADGDAGAEPSTLSEAEQATLAGLKAELDTLLTDIREGTGPDEFEQEFDCRRAVQIAERIGLTGSESASDASEGGGNREADETADAAPLAAVPRRLGPYEILGQLGAGGMGAVFKATHPKLKRHVAIKVLPRRRAGDGPRIARFQREMEALGALSHPHIVAAHDAGEDVGMPYLVMEYVDGIDLSALMRRTGPLAIADACEIVRQAALGLAEAYARGIVHRDIKPSNLMLAAAATPGSAPLVKILDFGLARLSPVRAPEAALTTSGLLMGTLKYMAPEQCEQSHAVDVRADIYSLGATLYKLLAGASPYSEERFDSPLSLLAALANEEPTPLLARRPDVPPALADVVHRMLAKNPAERVAAPDEIVAAMTPWAKGANLAALLDQARRAQPDEADDRAAQGVVPSDVAFALPRSSSFPRAAPRSVLIGLTALGALAALTLAAAALYRAASRDAAPSGPPPLSPEGVAAVAPGRLASLDDQSFVRSRSAAEWLAARGARFSLLTEDDGGHVTLSASAPLPPGRVQAVAVDLGHDPLLTDDDVERLVDLPMLELVNLSFTAVGDGALARLRDLPRLRHLFLASTSVTDAGLRELRRWSDLTTLYLSDTAVTDAGLEHVAELSALRELALVGCRVTDAGLAALREMTNLKVLRLENTRLTSEGVAELRSALPFCDITFDDSAGEIEK